jgi:UDP-N-acetylglucosamine transferase subunit ALG13
MKIYVTVGFESFSFDRLLRAVDEALERHLIAGEVLVQNGHSRYKVHGCESRRFLNFDEVVSRLREADIVVSHAGVGTTLLCLALGKIPILLPRRAHFHEHVDDHQVEFARKMESEGRAIVAHDEGDLIDKINRYGALLDEMGPSRIREKSASLKSNLEEILARCAAEGGRSR